MARVRILISEIKIGPRTRKDIGDLAPMKLSLGMVGMLHPIVILADGTLVAGFRRIMAAKELGWKDVPCHVIDLDNPMLGEQDENECRKDFTATEKLAIADAIAEKIKERRGNPNLQKSTSEVDSNVYAQEDELEETPEKPAKKQRTADYAAQKAGLGSADTVERIRATVKGGIDELVDLLNDGKVSPKEAEKAAKLTKLQQKKYCEFFQVFDGMKAIRAAKEYRQDCAKDKLEGATEETKAAYDGKKISLLEAQRLAKLDPEKQAKVVEKFEERKEDGKKALKAAESGLDELPDKDDEGVELPDRARMAFADREKVKAAARDIDRLLKEIKALCDMPVGRHIHFGTVETNLKNAKVQLWQNLPGVVCPFCKGKEKKCETCDSQGWVPKRKAKDHGQGK